MTSVACVDDNRLLGEALGSRLGREPGFAWLGCLHRAEGVLERLVELAPDLVLLDLDMPGLDPFALLEHAAGKLPGTRIVVITASTRASDRDHALASGAWGYLSKGISTPRLLEAMRRVMADEVVLDEAGAVDDGTFPPGTSPGAARPA